MCQDRNGVVRDTSATALAALAEHATPEGIASALNTLTALCQDRNWLVRDTSATALTALNTLATLCQDRNEGVRRDSATALTAAAVHAAPETLPAVLNTLATLCQDRNEGVRRDSASALAAVHAVPEALLAVLTTLCHNENNAARDAAIQTFATSLANCANKLPQPISAIWPYSALLAQGVNTLVPDENQQKLLLQHIQSSALNVLTFTYFYDYLHQLKNTEVLTEEALGTLAKWLQTTIWLAHPEIEIIKETFIDAFRARVPETLKEQFEFIIETVCEYDANNAIEHHMLHTTTTATPSTASRERQRSPTHSHASFFSRISDDEETLPITVDVDNENEAGPAAPTI